MKVEGWGFVWYAVSCGLYKLLTKHTQNGVKRRLYEANIEPQTRNLEPSIFALV